MKSKQVSEAIEAATDKLRDALEILSEIGTEESSESSISSFSYEDTEISDINRKLASSYLPIGRWLIPQYAQPDDSGKLQVGVGADHYNGIKHVVLHFREKDVKISSPTKGDGSRGGRYVKELDLSDCPPGIHELSATVVPVDGEVLELKGNDVTFAGMYSLSILVPHGDEPVVEVSKSGDLKDALSSIKEGGTVLIKRTGFYTISSGCNRKRMDKPIFLEAAPGVKAYLTSPSATKDTYLRPQINKIVVKNLILDDKYGGTNWYSEDSDTFTWDSCRFMNTAGGISQINKMPRVMRWSTGARHYINCHGENLVNGFKPAHLVSGCTIDLCGGDAWQNSTVVIDCLINGMRRDIEKLHLDIFQSWNGIKNAYLDGITSLDVKDTQNIFIQGGGEDDWHNDGVSIRNVVMTRGKDYDGPLNSQFSGTNRHVLLRDWNINGEGLLLRTDFFDETGKGVHSRFESEVFLIENIDTEPKSGKWGVGIPDNVEVR
jgi:hypothetical protein